MSQNSQQITPRPHPDRLRVDFIGMAFALAVGELGLEIGRFYLDGLRLRDHWHIVTHILLAIYIIASSWVGWQLSESRGNEEELKDTFSLSFFILLLDLLLVICYFIIVKSIEKSPETPSCNAQVFWSLTIFGVYIIWDIFTKLIVENDQGGIQFEQRKNLSRYGKGAYQAPICFLIIFFVVWPIRGANTTKDVICVDGLLISIFVLFRGLKAFDHSWRKTPKYVLIPILAFIITLLVQRNIISI